MILALALIIGSSFTAGTIVASAVLLRKERMEMKTAEEFLKRDREVPKEISRRAL
jgi:hypothetical protein